MQVQKSQPNDLLPLLKKVLKYLYHSNWETRLAAAQAVEAILRNVPVWSPREGQGGTDRSPREGQGHNDWSPREGQRDNDMPEGMMTLAMFDVKNLLENGQLLMSSEGKEFDVEISESNGDNSKQKQREKLNKQFGFDKLGLKSEQFIEDEDLTDNHSEAAQDKKKSASEILAEEIKSITGKTELSAREVNMLKRKAKMDARASKRKEEEAENEPKKIKIDTTHVKNESGGDNSDHIGEVTQPVESGQTWPLESFYDQLLTDIFSPRWERRHGAATGGIISLSLSSDEDYLNSHFQG